MGKPHNSEEFEEFLARLGSSATPDRREHPRLDLVVGVHLSRADRVADGATENLSRGGALVRSEIDADTGDIVVFEEAQSSFRTRAQVREVRGGGDKRRLHLHFLDAKAPDQLLQTHPR